MDVAPEAQELPEIYEGFLDGALFEAYVDDLTRVANVHSVRIRNAAHERADDHEIDLEQARLLLILGRVAGVQVRYDHEGIPWIDTLARRADSIRLLRMRAPVQVQKRRLPILTT